MPDPRVRGPRFTVRGPEGQRTVITHDDVVAELALVIEADDDTNKSYAETAERCLEVIAKHASNLMLSSRLRPWHDNEGLGGKGALSKSVYRRGVYDGWDIMKRALRSLLTSPERGEDGPI